MQLPSNYKQGGLNYLRSLMPLSPLSWNNYLWTRCVFCKGKSQYKTWRSCKNDVNFDSTLTCSHCLHIGTVENRKLEIIRVLWSPMTRRSYRFWDPKCECYINSINAKKNLEYKLTLHNSHSLLSVAPHASCPLALRFSSWKHVAIYKMQ